MSTKPLARSTTKLLSELNADVNAAQHQLLHEIANATTIISMNLEMLNDKLKGHSDPDTHVYLERIQRGAAQLLKTIQTEREKLRGK